MRPADRHRLDRVAGLALFYGASYALHPTRPLRTLLNVARERYESRLEMSLANLGRRLVRESLGRAGLAHRGVSAARRW